MDVQRTYEEEGPRDEKLIEEFSHTFETLLHERMQAPHGPKDEEMLAKVAGILRTPPESVTVSDIEALTAFVFWIDAGRGEEISEGGFTVNELQHFAQTPALIERWKTKNCVGSAMLMISVLRKIGVEAYFANPVGHAVTIVRLHDGTVLYADPSTSVDESEGLCVDVTKGNLTLGSESGLSLLKLPSGIDTGEAYELVPFHRSLSKAYAHVLKENMDEFVVDSQPVTQFALRLMGDKEVQKELACSPSQELLNLQASDAWKAEMERVGKSTHIDTASIRDMLHLATCPRTL